MRFRNLARAIATFSLVSLTPCWASSTLVVSSPVAGGARITSTIEIQDPAAAWRVHVGVAPNYLLFREGRLYSAQAGLAKDVTALGPSIRMPTVGDEQIKLIVSLTELGRTETIAGLTGRVIELKYYNTRMQEVSSTLVLSEDARVRENTDLWWHYHRSLGGPEHKGRQVLRDYLQQTKAGILQFGDDFRVEGFGVTPASDRFQLPTLQ